MLKEKMSEKSKEMEYPFKVKSSWTKRGSSTEIEIRRAKKANDIKYPLVISIITDSHLRNNANLLSYVSFK